MFRKIAHRGASARHTENTLEAFVAAAHAGATWFELDVWLSADGVPFVFHDRTLQRLTGVDETTEGMGMPQLAARRLHGGGTIPTLAQVLDAIQGPERGVYVEIKDPCPAVVPAVCAILAGRPGHWVVSSFHHEHVVAVAALAPHVGTMALVDTPDALDSALAGQYAGSEVGLDDALATPRVIRALVGLGHAVLVFTVNHALRQQQLREWGATGVYADTW